MNEWFEWSPAPRSLLLLWLTVPGIWLGAGALVKLLAIDRAVGRMLRPAVALAAWIVVVQVASMIVHSFWIGLTVGMITLSLSGFALWWAQRKATTAESPRPIGERPRFPRAMWLGMALTSVPIAIMAFQGHFHDEMPVNGHMSMTAQMQNDYFPPRLLGFSQIPLRYHYGFDLVCAGLTVLTRLTVLNAISAVTVFGWAYCWCLVWQLGERLTGRREGGLWTAMATMLGGGFAAFIAPFVTSVPWPLRLLGIHTLRTDHWLNPPVVSYVYQHPFSLGFPLAAAALLAAIPAPTKQPTPPLVANESWSKYGLLALFLAALSLTQTILFVSLAATFAFTEIVVARRWRFGAVLAAVFAVAWCMGGMLFTHISHGASRGLHVAFWPRILADANAMSLWHGCRRVFSWNVTTFGLLLPLGCWGLWRLRQLRLALFLLIAGGVAVPLCVSYGYSWDIVKFSTVAQLAMGIAAGGALTRLASVRTKFGRALLMGCLFGVTATACTWIATVLWLQGHNAGFRLRPVALAADDRQSMQWLRNHAKPDEMIYRLPAVAGGYFQFGGLSATSNDFSFAGMYGIAAGQIVRQNQLIATLPPDLESYRAIGIKWFVVAPDDQRMAKNVQQWEHDGILVEQAEFGQLRIFALSEPSSPHPMARLSQASAPGITNRAVETTVKNSADSDSLQPPSSLGQLEASRSDARAIPVH